MKQTLLSALCAGMVLSANAQLKSESGPLTNAIGEDTHVVQTSTRAGGSPNQISSTQQVDTIWYEDFANGMPSGWFLSGIDFVTCPWSYSTDGSWGFFNGNNGTAGATGINSTSAANGFLINDPDSSNNDQFGQPSGSNYQYLNSYITTTAISTVGFPAVRLEFEQFFRYNNSPELQVGVSTDGVTFTYFDAKGDVAANQASPNPMLYSIDISSIAGNSPTVYLQFGWEARVYYWMIDDIRLVTPPNNDLAITQTFFNGYQDTTQTRYYTQIPVKHANLDTLTFGAALRNEGSAQSTNTGIQARVLKDGNEVYINQYQNGTVGVAQTDSINIAGSFIPSFGEGDYEVILTTFSDSIDYDSTNNISRTNFTVTTNEYRRDNNNSNQGNWYNGNTWEMLVAYEIHETDTAIAVSCYFPDLTNGYGIDAGDPLSYFIYEENNLVNPVASNEFYAVRESDADSWVTLPMPQNTVLAPGTYYVGFKIFEQETAIGSFSGLNEDVPPFSVLVRVDGSPSDSWSYTTSVMPFVRLVTYDPNVCNDVNISINGTVVDSTYEGTITTTVSGGTEPYTYSWTGPNGFTSTNSDLNNLGVKGTYTLQVTDVNGCSSQLTDFNVAGVVSTNDIQYNGLELTLFPNPTTGIINLNLVQGDESNYVIHISDLKGRTVYSSRDRFNRNSPVSIDLSTLDKGVYFIRLTDDSRNSHSKRIVIR